MDISAANLEILFREAQNQFQQALINTPVIHPAIATTLPMGTRQTVQAFLQQVPLMRKWLGDRVINNAIAQSRVITAEPYENTISVDKFDIEDEQIALFSYTVQMFSEAGVKWPDQLVARFVSEEAATVLGYDGVPVYSENHPTLGGVAGGLPAGAPAAQSNLLLDTPLTWDNFVAAYTQMQSWVGPDGAPMPVVPDTLMVPPQLLGTAKQILEADFRVLEGVTTAPQSNTFKGVVKLLVNPWLRNMADADGNGNWWLLDTSSAIKPYIFYQRSPVTMTALTNPNDPNMFLNHKLMWGLEARGNACESVWWKSLAATSESQYYFEP